GMFTASQTACRVPVIGFGNILVYLVRGQFKRFLLAPQSKVCRGAVMPGNVYKINFWRGVLQCQCSFKRFHCLTKGLLFKSQTTGIKFSEKPKVTKIRIFLSHFK